MQIDYYFTIYIVFQYIESLDNSPSSLDTFYKSNLRTTLVFIYMTELIPLLYP